ncbi:MAG: methyltransferase domain-containing protein [Candidatus Latescibacterota bacterium]
MKRAVLDLLACPVCGSALEVESPGRWDESGGELLAGGLQCARRHWFPVVSGIPRLLPPELLREVLGRYHPEVLAEFGRRWSGVAAAGASLTRRTLRSFSYQWKVFSEMYAHWEENFRSYFEPLVPPAAFAGLRVLDAGCGFGRHAYYAGQYGAQVVALDLSEAVEAARDNTRCLPNVHVVQGDLYHPPVLPVFDLVYCVGVIQHLPDAAGGFASLASRLGAGGRLFVWVYGRRRGLYRLVDVMRRLSTRMPLRLLYGVTWVLNLAGYAAFCLPYRGLRGVRADRLAATLPFTRYADLPLRAGHADWFDRLSVPSTVYFARDQVEAWYRAAGLDEVIIQSREGIGWRALGQRAAARHAGTRLAC